jgi:2,3-bisphosphoglycerate-independent phosphoglycerate mutase
MIIDGFGLRDAAFGNAVAQADTPNFDALWNRWPHTALSASGLDVGLPEGQMGNSEVGHANLGAGRIMYQELTRISQSIGDGTFYENPAFTAAFRSLPAGGTLHIMGLVSDGGVHSHIDHLIALLEMAAQRRVADVRIHCFLDGRDSDPHSGLGFIKRLEREIEIVGIGRIATISGRYYAMDRDKRWDRVELAYEAIVNGQGPSFRSPAEAVRKSYRRGITDEFLHPTAMRGYQGIHDGDAIIFFNFRPDRARELTRAIVDPGFIAFEARPLQLSQFVCMTQYDRTMPYVRVAFAPQRTLNTLGQVIDAAGRSQLRIAETEKYAHVTFFFNCGVELPAPHERRILIPSPKVTTYDLKPEMSANEITKRLLDELDREAADFTVLNFANCDMVGHTGVFPAAVTAVETVDACIGSVVDEYLKRNGIVLITADHGNVEVMQNSDGSPMTAHTTNPVPFVAAGVTRALKGRGVLADVAPTILSLMEIEKPPEMSGSALWAD